MKHFTILSLLCVALISPPIASADSPADPGRTPVVETYAIASDGTQLQWEVYTPAGSGPWPAVLVIHGGLFISGSFDNAGVADCAQDLAAAGFVAFAINYRLAPPGFLPGQKSLGRYPDQYDDVQKAVLAARADERGNGLVGAVGGSAGGTHTAWVAATGQRGAERVDVGVGLSGAYDFSDFSPDEYLFLFQQAVTNYVGVPATDIFSLREASPAWNVDLSVSPLYLVDSAGDVMPADQLTDLVTHLRGAGARNFQAKTIGGDGHSFANWPLVSEEAIDFLARYFARVRMIDR